MKKNTIGIPSMHFAKRVRQQYNDITKALARELLQNAIDAGATEVKFFTSEESVVCEDDGRGMTKEDFEKFFLTLGATTKTDTDAMGCFGIAKELIALAWTDWQVSCEDFCCRGSGIEYSFTNGPRFDGFRVEIHDSFWTPRMIRRLKDKLRVMSSLSHLPLTVTLCDEDSTVNLKMGRDLSKLSHNANIENVGTIYGTGEQDNLSEIEKQFTGYIVMRTRGLWTGFQWVGSSPATFYLDITAPAVKVLTDNREGLRGKVCGKILSHPALKGWLQSPEVLEETVTESRFVEFGTQEPQQGSSSQSFAKTVIAGIEQALQSGELTVTVGPDGQMVCETGNTNATNLVRLPAELAGRIMEGMQNGTIATTRVETISGETRRRVENEMYIGQIEKDYTFSGYSGGVLEHVTREKRDKAWRNAFAVISEDRDVPNDLLDNNRLSLKYAVYLAAWEKIITEVKNLSVGSTLYSMTTKPGLLFASRTIACCAKSEGVYVLCVNPDKVDIDHLYYFLQVAVHELTHTRIPAHSGSDFEQVRMAIEKDITDDYKRILFKAEQSAKQEARVKKATK